MIRISWPYKFYKTITLTKCLQWRCIAAHFIQCCYLSSPSKSSNHITRRIFSGKKRNVKVHHVHVGKIREYFKPNQSTNLQRTHGIEKTRRWKSQYVVITEAHNRQYTRSPKQNLTLDWSCFVSCCLSQNKRRRDHEGSFFIKKTGSIPCTGTETTTITNTMLNTLKLRQVIGLKLRPNDCNSSMQHTATLSATDKSPAEIWSEWTWNSSTPTHISFHSY